MNKIQPTTIFSFQLENSMNHEVRTIQKEDGSIWFVAKDVCRVLNLTNSNKATRILEDDEKGVTKGYTPGGKQDLSIISESGLYTLVLRSNKPEAKVFRKWVTSEVLPSIRKTGTYTQDPQPQISPQAVTAFYQATTDTFWSVQKALHEYSLLVTHLRKAKKDISIIHRSIEKVFPEAQDTVDFIRSSGNDRPLLEVEMR